MCVPINDGIGSIALGASALRLRETVIPHALVPVAAGLVIGLVPCG